MELPHAFAKPKKTHRSESLLLGFKISLHLVTTLFFSLTLIKMGTPPHQQMHELKATIPKSLSSNRVFFSIYYMSEEKGCVHLGSGEHFKAYFPKHRKNYAKKFHLCFNYLKGHNFKDCMSMKVCQQPGCTKKHHILLHIDTQGNKLNP